MQLNVGKEVAALEEIPDLLPRPTQQEIGKRANVKESSVSRCMKDKNAALLRKLWAMAADLDAVLEYRGS